MSIRIKIIAIVIGSVLALCLLIALLSNVFIMRSYEQLERSYALQNAERVQAAIDDRLRTLEYTVHDWSSWTDTYDFLGGKNPDYVSDNLMDSAFISLRINLIALFDVAGTEVYAKYVDAKTGMEIPVPGQFSSVIAPLLPALLTSRGTMARTGLVLLPGSVMMVAARPVLTSNESGPAKGVMVMAISFDSAELQRFGDMTRLPLGMQRIDDPALPPEFRAVFAHFAAGTDFAARVIDGQHIAGYARVADIFGRPALVIRAQSARDIRANGLRTVWYFIMALVALSAIMGLLLWLLLERIFVRRLEHLCADAALISSHGGASDHVLVSGNDELSRVSKSINEMLDTLRHNQARLQQAQLYEAQGKLAGGTAHEFNNILAIMLGSLELVLDSLSEDNPERPRLEQARRAGERGKTIVRQILEFSRASRQKQVSLSLSDIVPRALDMVAALFTDDVRLVRRIEPKTGAVLANSTQMEQVVINLCKNALEAIGDHGGEVEVDLDDASGDQCKDRFPDVATGPYVLLRVRDTGSGIVPSDLNQIFDPFFTTKKIGQGIGLGLSVVQGIVQQHHGLIHVSSEPGAGTTFELLLPVIRAASVQACNETESGSSRQATRVLLVGDVIPPDGVQLEALLALGHDVATAVNGAEALRYCANADWRHASIFVDGSLTGQDVLALCGTMHILSPDASIVLCVGEHHSISAKALEAAGIVLTVKRPLTIRELLAGIDRSYGPNGSVS